MLARSLQRYALFSSAGVLKPDRASNDVKSAIEEEREQLLVSSERLDAGQTANRFANNNTQLVVCGI